MFKFLPFLGRLCFIFILLELFSVDTIASNGSDTLVKEKIREMFSFAMSNYLKHALPADELLPISCSGKDTFGSYMVTLVDSLDTFLVMGDFEGFYCGVDYLLQHLDFDKNISVSAFETNIRELGGLLAAHIQAERRGVYYYHPDTFTCVNGVPEPGHSSSHSNSPSTATSATTKFTSQDRKWRTLLDAAIDLGDRLLPVFRTPTGIPFGAVNLKLGVADSETRETSTAGGGTYALEMGMLSALTGDMTYSDAAYAANNGFWKRRSKSKGLVGNHIDIWSGKWNLKECTIGSNVDSFFEYMLKAGLLYGDQRYLEMFEDAYDAIEANMRVGDWYIDCGMDDGKNAFPIFNSLQAFWPGLQILYGDVLKGVRTLNEFYYVWKQYEMVPEGYNIPLEQTPSNQRGAPLRPELFESTYFAYRATKDPYFRSLGKKFVFAIEKHSRTDCGFASIGDVNNRRKIDHMPSYFLAETLKYLYLLFDDDSWVHENYIFTTEGHLFPYDYCVSMTGFCVPPDSIDTSWNCSGERYEPLKVFSDINRLERYFMP